jgi:antirestriction protein
MKTKEQLINEYGKLAEVLFTGYSDNIDDVNRMLEDNYYGEYDSELDFTEKYVDEIGYLDDVPDHLVGYIDYDAIKRDLFIGDVISFDVDGVTHVFHRL